MWTLLDQGMVLQGFKKLFDHTVNSCVVMETLVSVNPTNEILKHEFLALSSTLACAGMSLKMLFFCAQSLQTCGYKDICLHACDLQTCTIN